MSAFPIFLQVKLSFLMKFFYLMLEFYGSINEEADDSFQKWCCKSLLGLITLFFRVVCFFW